VRNFIFAVILCLLFACLCYAQQEEKLTITTYYPSPTGVYNQLQAKRVVIGDVNADGQINSADVPATARPLFVQGSTTAMTTAGFANAAGYGVGIGSADGLTVGTIQSHFYQNGVSSGPAPNLTINFGGGNVGIGTMSPRGRLEVNGSILSNDSIGIIGHDDGTNWRNQLRFWNAAGSNIDHLFYQAPQNNNALQLYLNFSETVSPTFSIVGHGGAKVGINTVNPGFALDVADRMRVRQGTNTAGIWFYQTTPAADRAFVGMRNDDYVGLWGHTGAGWGMVMNTTNGNVGIGTTTPTAKLHVVGGINVTGAQSNIVEHVLVTGTPACTATCPAGKRIILALFFHGANANNMIHMLQSGWVCGSAVTWMGQCLGATSCSGSAVSCGSCSLYVLCE